MQEPSAIIAAECVVPTGDGECGLPPWDKAWQALSGVALPRAQSRDMILKLVKEL